jgi:diguanylate cyclase (GGDEF)-like protein
LAAEWVVEFKIWQFSDLNIDKIDFSRTGSRYAGTALILVVLITVVGFCLISGRTLLDMHRAEWESARQSSANIASTLDADISRNIELYDLSLHAVASNILLPELETISKSLRHLVLFDQAATAKHFGPIKVYSSSGDVVDDSTILVPWTENGVDADFFKIHLQDGGPDLFISDPVMDARGEYAIHLSRRINKADGSFGGVVAGSIKISYFHDLFRQLDIKSQDSFTLINRRGVVVMRIPFEMDYIGKNLSRGIGVSKALKADSGWYERVSEVDQIDRLYVWEAGKHPLFVIAGRSLNQIYANWLDEAKAIIAAMVALILMMVALTAFLLREMKQTSRLQVRLAEMAMTDGLTGLANRRYFDQTIAAEWYRALRQRTVISVLMIDADDFKKYNDQFGHQAGDQLLGGIAQCISENVRRAGDCGARYGGEEFSVVLPGANAQQASAIAERIRNAVMGIPLDKAAASVSIGVASIIPSSTTSFEDLIISADKALYLAKANGKNRTIIYGESALKLVG